jgi:hypothetical protein
LLRDENGFYALVFNKNLRVLCVFAASIVFLAFDFYSKLRIPDCLYAVFDCGSFRAGRGEEVFPEKGLMFFRFLDSA